MDKSWLLSHAVDLGNFLSLVGILRLAVTSPRVAGTLNWIALCRNDDDPRTTPRSRNTRFRPQLPLVRPRPPITFSPRAAEALCRIAGLDKNNAEAFRRLATRGGSATVVTTSSQDDYETPTDANFVAVACGSGHSVGLRGDGTVVTWAGTHFGERVDAPTGTNFVAVACGEHHSVGLQDDGTVMTWGHGGSVFMTLDFYNYNQRNDVPTNPNFVVVACGNEHCVGLRPDGTVVTWGGWEAPTDSIFVAVACGGSHTVGLRPDGTVVTWICGELHDSQRDDAPTDSNFVAIACGCEHSVGLRADGTVAAWG